MELEGFFKKLKRLDDRAKRYGGGEMSRMGRFDQWEIDMGLLEFWSIISYVFTAVFRF